MNQKYKDFFQRTPEGVAFIEKLHGLIDANHVKGENVPEEARDYMQRAKGVREVLSLVSELCVVLKPDTQEEPASR